MSTPSDASSSTLAPANASCRVLLAVPVPSPGATEGATSARTLGCLLQAHGAIVDSVDPQPEAIADAELSRPTAALVKLRPGDPASFAVMRFLSRSPSVSSYRT